jgi:arylsulfatase A-like enzyme
MIRDSRYKVIVYHGIEPGELYDLEQDPDEHVNLWDDPAYKDVKSTMVRKCLDSSVFTMDPLPKRIAAF